MARQQDERVMSFQVPGRRGCWHTSIHRCIQYHIDSQYSRSMSHHPSGEAINLGELHLAFSISKHLPPLVYLITSLDLQMDGSRLVRHKDHKDHKDHRSGRTCQLSLKSERNGSCGKESLLMNGIITIYYIQLHTYFMLMSPLLTLFSIIDLYIVHTGFFKKNNHPHIHGLMELFAPPCPPTQCWVQRVYTTAFKKNNHFSNLGLPL